MIFPAQFRRVFFSAVVFGIAAGTLFAASKDPKDFSEDEKINGKVEGYFVRVKSRISGEKQLYYNPDGTLKKADGDGLLGGDFSLDESLLSADDGGFPNLDFPAPNLKKTENVPAPAPEKKDVPASGKQLPATSVPASEKSSADDAESAGTVDEHSILKKFASTKEKDEWGIAENWKNIKEMRTDERFSEKFSMSEWKGSSAYGLRRYAGTADGFEMRAAEKRGDDFAMNRFDASSRAAGERMFVRSSDDGTAVEVLFDRRFSPGTKISASERAKPLFETSGFSMQDINRYQFRRNRSSESGIPVVSPDSGENVRMEENFGKKASLK